MTVGFFLRMTCWYTGSGVLPFAGVLASAAVAEEDASDVAPDGRGVDTVAGGLVSGWPAAPLPPLCPLVLMRVVVGTT